MANDTVMNLNQSVDLLQRMGFFNYALPLGIFFLILYGILDQYNVVSENKKINALLSLLISSFILLYAYVTELEWFFSEFYTKMSIAIIIILFAVTLAVFAYRGLASNEIIPEGKNKLWGSIMIMVSTLIVNSSFSNAPAPLGNWASEVSGLVLAFGFIGAILSPFIAKGGEE